MNPHWFQYFIFLFSRVGVESINYRLNTSSNVRFCCIDRTGCIKNARVRTIITYISLANMIVRCL